MEAMTLDRVSEALRGLAKVIRQHGTCAPMALEKLAGDIDAHLAQPAQAVDAYDLAAEIRRVDSNHNLSSLALSEALMPFLTRALSSEKAGPVGDGWQPIETAPKDGTYFLAGEFSGNAHEMLQYEIVRYKPGLFPEYKEAGNGLYRVEMVPIYEWEANNFHAMTHWHPLPASPTPDKEGA